MLATLQMNAMGHVHIWPGEVEVEQTEKYNFTGNGQDSPVYLQAESDIEGLRREIPFDIWAELDRGWSVQANIDSLYFGE